MRDSDFAAYLFCYMLKNHFHTQKRMAQALGITVRTLQYNFQHLGQEKGGSYAFFRLIPYCLQNGFSIDEIYDEYIDTKQVKTTKTAQEELRSHDTVKEEFP